MMELEWQKRTESGVWKIVFRRKIKAMTDALREEYPYLDRVEFMLNLG